MITGPRAASLLGGAYDPRGRRVWVASGRVPQTSASLSGFVGLLSIAEDVRRIAAPAGVEAAPGDVAVAADGTVYVSDGQNGAIYICRPGCAVLEVLLAPGTLFSAQGLAVSADQRLLYIADRRYGLAALDRRSGRLMRVAGSGDMMLDGIDGLALFGRDLIATQTAYAPHRIIRLRLSPDRLRVVRLDVLERAHPEWGEVTLGQVVDGAFVYVADAQWDRFGPGGVPSGTNPPRATPIRSLRLPR